MPKATPTHNEAEDANVDQINYGPLSGLIGYRLKKAYGYSIQTWDELFKDLGLAYGQYSVLLLIGMNPGLSQLSLAGAAGLDGSTVVPITNKFVNLGWIRRTRRRDDRRMYSLKVTAAGQAVLDRAQLVLKRHEEDLVTPLTVKERVALLELLTKITDDR